MGSDVKNTIDPKIITFYALHGASFVCTFSLLILCLIKGLHRKFMTELMIYVFISESINSLSIFLSLLRDIQSIDSPICVAAGLIQIILEIFCDFWTLATSCLITFKIYDLLNKNSLFFNLPSFEEICRCIIFLFPAIVSLIIFVVQSIYCANSSCNVNDNGKCSGINCFPANNLMIGLLVLIFLLLLLILVITIKISRFIKIHLNNLPMNNPNESDKLISKMKSIRCKSLCFPIICWPIWVLLYLDRLLKIVATKFEFYAFCMISDTIDSLRGIIFSILFYYTQTNLKRVFRKICQKKRQKEKLIDTEDYNLNSSSSVKESLY